MVPFFQNVIPGGRDETPKKSFFETWKTFPWKYGQRHNEVIFWLKIGQNWLRTWICPNFVLVRYVQRFATGWTFFRHILDYVQNISSFCPSVKCRNLW